MSWLKRKPVQCTSAIAASIAIALMVAFWYVVSRKWAFWPWLLSWLAAVNFTTFGMYGTDKLQARRSGWRIPEKSLLGLGFAGGVLGAWLGMNLFRHKTIKGSYQFAFWLLFALQVILAAIVIREIWL